MLRLAPEFTTFNTGSRYFSDGANRHGRYNHVGRVSAASLCALPVSMSVQTRKIRRIPRDGLGDCVVRAKLTPIVSRPDRSCSIIGPLVGGVSFRLVCHNETLM